MALKGTIKDFGIADIFQLIGQQTKTGVLVLKHETDEVRVYFQSGAVVRAESSTRPQSQLLGQMMVEAELLTKQELDRALAEQARTLKKIGTVLTELDLASVIDVRDFAHLQMTETVYALFTWDSGTYEFEQTESVPVDEGVEPIRAEGILMEGLRMIDEWPTVRARLPNLKILPEKLKPLPEPKATDDDFDVFGFEGENSKVAPKIPEIDIGPNERRVFGLIESGRDLQRLIHLSRLGEFETCRVILTLADGAFIRLVEPKPVVPPPSKWRPGTWLLQAVSSAALVVLGAVMVTVFDGRQLGLDVGSTLHYRSSEYEGYLAETQLDVIRRGLDVYRLEKGRYPASLDALAEAGIVRPRDLRFPFSLAYYYRLEGESYVLLPPLF